MRAIAVAPVRRSVEVVDHPEPGPLSATDVRLRMLEVGVCGTDREIAAFEYGTPPAGSDYLVLGHESLGEVVEVGPEVSSVEVGSLVVPMVRRPCARADCVPCRSDRQDFCATGEFTERGINGRHGYMTELVVDDERYMNLVPGDLRDVAVLVEPLTIAEKALAEAQHIQDRLPSPHGSQTAVVLGAGPVGLLGAMALVARGFDTYVYSRSPAPNDKASLVEAIGARYVASATHTVEQLVTETGNIDLVYEAVGASTISFAVLEVLGTNGIFIFTGVPGRKAPIEIDTDLLMRNLVLKNQVVFGSVNAPKEAFQAAITDLAGFSRRWPDAVRSLVTGRYPIEAHHELLVGRAEGIKNVIVIDGAGR